MRREMMRKIKTLILSPDEEMKNMGLILATSSMNNYSEFRRINNTAFKVLTLYTVYQYTNSAWIEKRSIYIEEWQKFLLKGKKLKKQYEKEQRARSNTRTISKTAR